MKMKKINFFLFLQLLLLKRGGEQIFSGPIGRHGSQLIIYFEVRKLRT